MSTRTNRRTGPINFFRQVRAEGRKVIWSTRKETLTTTVVVFVMIVIVSLFFLLVDWGLGAIVSYILSFSH